MLGDYFDLLSQREIFAQIFFKFFGLFPICHFTQVLSVMTQAYIVFLAFLFQCAKEIHFRSVFSL